MVWLHQRVARDWVPTNRPVMTLSFGEIPSVTFFFPYREVSGVPVLFARMARYLAGHYGLETRVVDYRDGYMSRTLANDAHVKVIDFADGAPVHMGADTVLVLQSILPYTIRPELHIDRDTRMLFWTLHPFNWIPTIIPLPWFRHLQARYVRINRWVMKTVMLSLGNELRSLLRSLVEKKSVLFMDGATLRSTCQRLELEIDRPIYVPVPCEVPATKSRFSPTQRSREEISFSWVGRLADFKTHILVHTIRRLSEYAAKTRTLIAMHIIGAGPQADMIDRLRVDHEWFRTIRLGVLADRSLDDYLLEHVDVLAAMGTSALEGAKLGVPTILLDPCYGPVSKDYRFRWLFESSEFGLGELGRVSRFERNNGSLETLISSIRSEYQEISEKTYRYCEQNHSIESVAEKFVSALHEASFRCGDFRPEILRKSIIRKSYQFVRRAAGWR